MDKSKIKRGDFVKIVRDGERFWVEVTGMHDDGSRAGRVNNHLLVAPYRFGEDIRFVDDEVLQWLPEETEE